jgi:trk system potassium uptake protein TrkH
MKTKEIANIIVIVYISLIAVETILLKIFGMNWFDAVCHSFATVATGGFSTKNTSVAYFNNISIEIIIMFFMLISSMHFGLIYNTIRGRKLNIFTSSVVRSYVIVMFIGILLVAGQLTFEKVYSSGESLRYAAFQVISLGTTTGFAIVDTPNWPIFAILIQMYFTIQCGMVGSTSGGLKFDRIYLFFKSLIKQIRLTKHPQGIYAIKVDGTLIDSDMELQTAVFILLYIITFFVTTLLLTAMKIDGMTAFSAAITTLGNAGPGFGKVSSLGNYSGLPDAAKYILSGNMLLGRLEIMNIIVFLTMLSRKR